MRYKLQKLRVIQNAEIEKLGSQGIFDSDDLLFHASSPKRRKSLSDRTNIREDDLLRWAGISDLLRIKGIGIITAIKLVDSGGIIKVGDFISAVNKRLGIESVRSPRRNKPTHKDIFFAAKVFCFEEGNNLNPLTIANAYDEALELIPRLTTHNEENEVTQFELEVDSFYKTSSRESLASDLAILLNILRIIAMPLLPLILCWAVLALICSPIFASNEAEIMTQYQNIKLKIWFSQYGLFALILVLGYLVISFLNSQTVILEKKLTKFLFNRSGYRNIFLDIKNNNSKNARTISRFFEQGMFILGSLMAVATVFFMLFEEPLRSNLTTNYNNLLLSFTIWGGITIGIGISIPTLKSYYSRYKDKDTASEDAVKSFLILNFFSFAKIPIFIFLLIKLFIPLAFSSFQFSNNTLITPIFKNELVQAKSELQHLVYTTTDDYVRDKSLEYIENIDSETIPHLYSPQITVLADSMIPLLERSIGALIWMVLIVVGLGLVMPYFFLGGWKRGVFYILVLASSFYVEEVLQKQTPEWFFIKQDSISAFLIIAFVIFANAVFFDWLYDAFKSKKKICENCGANINIEDRFCVDCGLPLI